MSDIRPQFFVVREDSTITPLVALDELPCDVTVRGVPRNMNAAETRGMTSLGTIPSRGAYYIVEGLADRVGITEITDDSFAITPFTGGGAGKLKNRFSDKKVNGSPSKQAKVYCSYWIRRGECDFEQQGCRFKHVMPQDLETLQSIGLNDIPLWYREKFHVPSLRSGSRPTYVKSNWRKPHTPPKAIESHAITTPNGGDVAAALAAPAFTLHSNVSTDVHPKVQHSKAHPDPFYAGDPLGTSRDGDKDDAKSTITANGSATTTATTVSPSQLDRGNDYERTGETYIHKHKYETPQTTTAQAAVRSRRAFESQCPNHDYSMSTASSTPSMSHTVDSFVSPKSSMGGSAWSSPNQAVTGYTKADMDAVDDTLDKLNDVLAEHDAEPEHRSISELLPFSQMEDRYGNIIPEEHYFPVAMLNWSPRFC